MIKKCRSIINKTAPTLFVVLILLVWQGVVSFGIVPAFLLPAPVSVIKALITEFPILMQHMGYTLLEAFLGLLYAIAAAFLLAVLMDRYAFFYKALYPILIITQTVPAVAIAPLLVLWMGYGIAPKIALIFIVCFFPVTVGLLDGFRSADRDSIRLLRSMGANSLQVFWHIKLPYAFTGFLSGLKLAVSYAVVGAVIAEWLGGLYGLGVYMTRARKAYAFDKMFAVILLVSVISLLMMWGVDVLSKKNRLLLANQNKYQQTIKKARSINMKRIIKKWIALAVAIMLAMSLFGCATSSSTRNHTQLQPITVVLDWTPNTNHTGLYVAQANGYYEQAGLAVEIVQPPEDGALPLVASGKAQFGISFQEELGFALAASQPLPVEAVATILAHNDSGIISRKEDEITSPKAMEGKVYASWDSPFEQAVLREVLKLDGGDYANVKAVPNTVTDVISALRTNVDAVWIYYGWDGIAAECAGLDFNYFAFRDVDPALDFYTPILVSSSAYLDANPEQATAFLEATRKGYEYAIEHPQEAAKCLVAASPEIDLELATNSQVYLAGQYKEEGTEWGTIDRTRWDRFYQWMFEKGVVTADLTGKGLWSEAL